MMEPASSIRSRSVKQPHLPMTVTMKIQEPATSREMTSPEAKIRAAATIPEAAEGDRRGNDECVAPPEGSSELTQCRCSADLGPWTARSGIGSDGAPFHADHGQYSTWCRRYRYRPDATDCAGRCQSGRGPASGRPSRLPRQPDEHSFRLHRLLVVR